MRIIAAPVLILIMGLIVAVIAVRDWLAGLNRRLALAIVYGGDEAERAHQEWLHS